MEAHDDDELGPIDIVVIGYPVGAPMTGEAMPIFLDLVDRGIIRVLDALFVVKDADGAVSGFDASDLDVEGRRGLRGPGGRVLRPARRRRRRRPPPRRSIPGRAAVMIVYENRWAAPFAAAVRRNGGVVVASEPHPRAGRGRRPRRRRSRRPDRKDIPCQDYSVESPAPPSSPARRPASRNRVSRRQAQRWGEQDAVGYQRARRRRRPAAPRPPTRSRSSSSSASSTSRASSPTRSSPRRRRRSWGSRDAWRSTQ